MLFPCDLRTMVSVETQQLAADPPPDRPWLSSSIAFVFASGAGREFMTRTLDDRAAV